MSRKLNVDKMRRHRARSTSDSVWRTFSFENREDYVSGYDEWRKNFSHMMKLKHGENLKGISCFQSDVSFGETRVQLVAKLYEPPGSRPKRVEVKPEFYTPNEIRKMNGFHPFEGEINVYGNGSPS